MSFIENSRNNVSILKDYSKNQIERGKYKHVGIISVLAVSYFWNGQLKMEEFFSKAFVLFYRGKKKMYVYNKQTEERICKADSIGNTRSWKITSNCLSCYSTRLKFHEEQLCKAEQLWDPCCKFNCTPFPEDARNYPFRKFAQRNTSFGIIKNLCFHQQVRQ